MTIYPNAFDNDSTIIRVDDQLSELGTEAINQLRAAVFAIEKELGITPSGSKSSLDARISVSLNEDGSLKGSALTAAGLVSLPIVDSHVANNAGIKEFKLDLDVSTQSLQTQIDATEVVALNAADLANETSTNLTSHVNGVFGRHDDDHIDITATLLDKDGVSYGATNLELALEAINNALTTHENLTSTTITAAHPAAAISVFAADWRELPADAADVQEVLDFIDNQESISTGTDRATLSSNGIPRNARVEKINLDGYADEIVSETRVVAYLAEPSQTGSRDSITNGDDVISFVPTDNTDYVFDAMFTNVRPGDVLRINYGNGISGMFKISSVRFTPGSDWTVRIDGFNLANRDGDTDGYAYARIDRTRHDTRTDGVLAVAGAPADVVPDGSCANALDGVIVGSPRGAMAIGVGFDAGALNDEHYNLWLRLYPGGDPDIFVDLPAIDVTGDAGVTPGTYTLEKVVESTNRAFRASGYNYRFIAFHHRGEFGIMLADAWNEAAFSIITGEVNGTTVDEGVYTNNVIGDATDGYDALGFGASRAVVASPVSSTFSSGLAAANLSTIIHQPISGRDYMVDGSRRDFLRTKTVTQGDGYYEATVQDFFEDVPNNTITSTYRINQVLSDQEIKPGKSVVIQPTNPDDPSITGYGRFIVGDVVYGATYTEIFVINACHGTADPRGAYLAKNTEVLLYFTEDSVAFNFHNLASQGTYHRYHEVFVGPLSETTAVERARMVKQSADVAQLNTDRNHWQIRNVSSNMRGTRVDDTFRYWKRLYIIDYDASTGEYDGYLGDPPDLAPTPGIENPGPLTRGTKNKVVRFFDDSHVNYIDIQFTELATGPNGTTIADNPPQYIDIEIFPSMTLDDEVMVIAGVSHNETAVGSITDLREFGTTSEENFTDSAIRFIEAGERYLHANGVVRGFEYLGEGVNEANLLFSGGIGLVNGSFVAVDTLSCTIPESRDSSTTLNYFICLTQNGTLRAIPEIQAGKVQFFDNTTGEFVESLSFVEIVDNRKDLLLLYVANVTIGSLTVNSVTDVKRHVTNESINNWSVNVVGAGEIDRSTATFKSLEALQYWVNVYDISEVEVKIVTIEASSSLTFFTDTRLFGGTLNLKADLAVTNGQIENCSLTITSVSGLTLTSSDLRNSSVLYMPATDPGYVANDLISAGLGFAVYVNNFSNVLDNTFTSTSAQRPPFVFNNSSEGSTLRSIAIERNLFRDTVALDNSAVCLDHVDLTGTTAALLKNVTIKDNECNVSQNITVAARGVNNAGWYCKGVEISNNTCGPIGYLTSSAAQSGYGLVIANNNCTLISTANTAYSSGHSSASSSQPLGSGHVTIKDNVVFGKIDVYVDAQHSNSIRGSINVTGNTVYADLNATVSAWFGAPTLFSAIFVGTIGVSGSDYLNMSTHISDNKVFLTIPDNGTVTTERGIFAQVGGGCNIHNNRVDVAPSNASTSSFAELILIRVAQAVPSGQCRAIISGNQLNRLGYDITNYIVTSTGTTVEGEIVDNYLDDWDVGTGVIADAISAGDNLVVLRNKNHRQQKYIGAFGGYWTDNVGRTQGTTNFGPFSSISNFYVATSVGTNVSVDFILRIVFSEAVASGDLRYKIPLAGKIPVGTSIINASISFDGAGPYGDESDLQFGLQKQLDEADTSGFATLYDLNDGASGTLITPDVSFAVDDEPIIFLRVNDVEDAGTGNLDFNGLLITYQW